MFFMLSTDASGAHVAFSVRNDITCEITNPSLTVSQIQTALAAISTRIGHLGAAGATVARFDGHSGTN